MNAAPDPEHRRRERERQDDHSSHVARASKPTSGQGLYRGKNIYELAKTNEVYRTDVQPVFQDPYGIYNPFYRVDRVFKMAIKKFGLASSKAERRDLIEEALRAVNLRPADVLGRYPHQLSGGERQRVMLARAYMLRPKVIIADEPISMLDVAVRAIFMNILLDFKERYGMSTLFITHDLSDRLLPRRRHHGHARGRVGRGRPGRRRDGDPGPPVHPAPAQLDPLAGPRPRVDQIASPPRPSPAAKCSPGRAACSPSAART